MAEEAQRIINMEVDSDGNGEEDEAFYENIEAPKFVDLTTPDCRRSGDDRYWFCSRVGCNQKHEEELDSEAIYKNFVLRVMAARSPNVKLQKALNRTASSKYTKCPGSAPAKSSKPRLSRLAVVASIPSKLADPDKDKVTTPKAKTKQVAAKYLTTPRNKNCIPNPNTFRSVQNPKQTTTIAAAPQNRTVAKALVFHSPKKGIAVKTSVELRTPLSKKLCDGMKRHDLTSQKKRVKDPALGSNKSLPGRKLRVTFKDQSDEKVTRQSQIPSAQGIKSSRNLKSKGKGKLMEQCPYKESVPGIDSVLSEANEEHLGAKEMEGQCSSMDQVEEEKGVERAEVPNEEKDDCGERIAHDDERADSENEVNCENHSADGHTSGREVMDSDDKENASAFDENRSVGGNIKKAAGNMKKVTQASEKSSKEGSAGMKFRKPKPTNPKPFRFRTDERGILKEANLEKKALQDPKQANTKASKITEGNLPRKHEKNIHFQGDDVLAEHQDKCNNDTPAKDQKSSQRKILGDLMKAKMKTHKPEGEESSESASATTTPINSNSTPRSATSLRKTKTPLKTFQPQSPTSSKKQDSSSCLTPGQKLHVIKETSSLVSKSRRKGDGEEKKVIGSATTGTARRRRPVTIPKEPNFHTSHRPKSCTKPLA